MKDVIPMNEKTRRVAIVVAVILGLAALLYLGGLLGQLMSNYNVWLSAGGMMGKAQMQSPDLLCQCFYRYRPKGVAPHCRSRRSDLHLHQSPRQILRYFL